MSRGERRRARIGHTHRIADVLRRDEWLDRTVLDAVLRDASGR